MSDDSTALAIFPASVVFSVERFALNKMLLYCTWHKKQGASWAQLYGEFRGYYTDNVWSNVYFETGTIDVKSMIQSSLPIKALFHSKMGEFFDTLLEVSGTVIFQHLELSKLSLVPGPKGRIILAPIEPMFYNKESFSRGYWHQKTKRQPYRLQDNIERGGGAFCCMFGYILTEILDIYIKA